MQKFSSLLRFFLLLSATSLLFACGQPAESSTDSSNNNSQGNPGEDTANSVCYTTGACFPVVTADNIQDSGRDYQYPNPSSFPTKSLRPQYARPQAFIDLRGLNLNKKVAPNFTAAEFLSAAKGRYGILSRGMVARLQQMRKALGKAMLIHSGYRSPGYNSGVDGSATWSRHTYGDGVDLHASGVSLKTVASQCKKAGASFTLLYAAHVHCDWRLQNLDNAFYATTLQAENIPGEIDPYFFTGGYIGLRLLEDQKLELSVQDFFAEEPGELVYEWTVQTPDGAITTYETPMVVIPKLSGTTHVEVLVGDSVYLEKSMTW